MICKTHTLTRTHTRARTLLHRAPEAGARVTIPEQGFTLAGVLVLIAILSIFMAMSVPIWDRIKQRENEEELIFRGREYIEAIARYHQKYNSYPPDVKTLYEMKFLRRKYKDPMTKSGEWKLLHPDSLVQTGAAGAINQPGAKNPAGGNDDTQLNPEDQPNTPNSDTDHTSGDYSPGDQDLSSKKKSRDDEEEPEASPDDKEISLGPIVGVVSRSKKSSLLIYNGQSTYNKWIFAYVPQQQPEQQQKPGGKPGKDKGGKNPKTPLQPPTTPGANNPGTNQNNNNQN